MERIYLDHNSTTKVLPEVKDKLLSLLDTEYNASSIHYHGRKARKFIEDARRDILYAVGGVENYDLIFTSSGTEANNLFIKGAVCDHLFLSPIEHASIIEPAKLKNNVSFLNVDANGLLNIKYLEKSLKEKEVGRAIISVMLANNETGVIQNLKQICKIAHKYNALVHTDAVQAFGKIEFNLKDLDVDLMTISAHKIGGMFGAAALIKHKSIDIQPILHGGGQEKKIRAGTENIQAIVAFAEAANLVPQILEKYKNIKRIRDNMESLILKIAPETKVYSKEYGRLPNTSCIAMDNIDSETQLINFDLKGFSISAGSACSSGKIEVSHVLSAMNSEDKFAKNAIRISLGIANSEQDAIKFTEAWKEIYILNVLEDVV